MLLMQAALAVVMCLGPARARAQDLPDLPAWPDTYESRLTALALIQTLNADLLASRSATLSLERWCRDHRLAAVPRVVARPLPGPGRAPTTDQRRRLGVGEQDDVRYRRVQLVCGDRVLSHAESWYVPGRLTAEMNRTLETTDTPMGRVVEALEPYRLTVATELLWAPLPADWVRTRQPVSPPGRTLDIPDAVFTHQAVVYSADGRPFAVVREVYQRGVLAHPPLANGSPR